MMSKSYFPMRVPEPDDDEFILTKILLICELLYDVAASHYDLIGWKNLDHHTHDPVASGFNDI
jgi:hypothetical protein